MSTLGFDRRVVGRAAPLLSLWVASFAAAAHAETLSAEEAVSDRDAEPQQRLVDERSRWPASDA
jgi:hypothetical protein